MIAAILRAQLLSMRMGARRGAVFSAITGVIWYGIWVCAALAAGFMAWQANEEQLSMLMPLAFLGVCGYWQLIPVISATMGAGLDMRKLLPYPVPPGSLFVVELLLRVLTGAEMVLVLAGGTAGLLANRLVGGWAGAPRVIAAALAFAVFNVLLASGVRSLLERLLTKRKVREVLTFFLLMLYIAPRIAVQSGSHLKGLAAFSWLAGTRALPWGAAAAIAAGVPRGGFDWAALASLGAWAAVALWFGRVQFQRNLRYDAVAAQATPQASLPGQTRWTERFYRLPSLLWSDPLAALVEKELRSLARTPRFRMVFVMGFTFGLVVWFPMIAGRRSHEMSGGSPYFLIIVCVYALTLMGQVTYWNCFGFDRSAAVFYYAAPQPVWKTLAGKNIASLVFIYLEVVVLVSVTAALRAAGGWQTIVETLGVVAICALYMLALGNLSSVNYPRGLSPERVSQGGSSGRFQGLLFLIYPLALLPIFLAYLARFALRSETVFVVALAIAAAAGAVLYRSAIMLAADTAVRRREEILTELSKGDGPVAAQ